MVKLTIRYRNRGYGDMIGTTECGRTYVTRSANFLALIAECGRTFGDETPVQVYWDAVSGNNPNNPVLSKPMTPAEAMDILVRATMRKAA